MTRAVYIVLYPPDLKSSGQPRVLFMLSTTRRLLKVSEIPCDDGDVLSGEFFQLSSCRRLCTCVDWHTWTRLCANDCRSCVSLTCNGGELAWGSGYEYVVVLLLFFDTQLPLIALILSYDSCLFTYTSLCDSCMFTPKSLYDSCLYTYTSLYDSCMFTPKSAVQDGKIALSMKHWCCHDLSIYTQ